MSNLDALVAALPRIVDGIIVTVQLTLGGAALALAVAVVFGISARTPNRLIRYSARTVIEVLRGTSLLVQLFWLFFVLPAFGIRLEPILVGILALGLNYGAYGAEVVRGSLNAVPKVQWEAAIALNFSPAQRMRRVIFPQAWVLMIPALANLLIHLLKGTAIATAITLQDLTFRIDRLRETTGDTFFAFGIALLIYFVLAYILTLFMHIVEARAKHRLGRGPSMREIFKLKPDTLTAELAIAKRKD
ncbi:ectoine/hydroxyectoine ABC transporter permease subunit EhuC [Hoyosella rhizosphaerae]|uniref:Ectoine/hydroxyectoine ABC transporter permease subunit EhuC n=1 Tax=Hoyosella rhizosphaerae TaxID=1755582 RepID=A0A916U275_9ACTN|nr:ectoine/hydroxyectoine ABC transporter permease subunit EhuC [Hoyosella rhizosphaerae]MBN4926758.1 ectoine/hydroxyectoine ABC transporter permease subunit EhuC [Hoyosella rhizosphaerae]GGC56719.1 ectoine/hydroxyectoine ABC transporter permease subunit EhuC [Hoyosella rhizosphaerae]